MIIHQPEIIYKEGHAILWSKIEMATPETKFPEYLWYRVPEQYAENLVLQSDAFLLPGLMGGMYYRESIQVRGTVSPRLAYHLDEYQIVLSHMMSKAIEPVDIQYERLLPLEVNPKAVGATFSGGVDTLFTLMNHAPETQPNPEYQISHGLFINAFNIVRKYSKKYDALFARYTKTLSEISIELVPIDTNISQAELSKNINAQNFSFILAGCALSLSSLFKRFVIASTFDHTQLRKGLVISSTPYMDRLFSTETLDFEHYGTHYKRVDKIAAISKWEFAQENLRVCNMPSLDSQVINCSRCEKCTRTMVPLYALGNLEKFVTFQRPLKSNKDALYWARKFNPELGFVTETFDLVKKQKPDLLPWLRVAAALGTIRFWIFRLIPNFVKNFLQRYGYFVDDYKDENAFEDYDVMEWIAAHAKQRSDG